MNKLFLIFITLFLFISCKERENELIEGPQSDTIGLSTKKIEFSNAEDSLTVTTKGDEWYIIGLSDNGKTSYYPEGDNYKSEWIIIERVKSNEIFIKVQNNKDNIENKLNIVLQDKNYADNLTIIQK